MSGLIDSRTAFVTEVALSMLCQWYVTWEAFKDHGDAWMRRLALHSKARGLVCHDRAIVMAAAVING